MFKAEFFLSVLFVCSCILKAQERQIDLHQLAEKRLAERGELIILFVKPANMKLDYLTTFLSIDGVKHDTVTAYANEIGFRQFLAEDIPYELLQPPSTKEGVLQPYRDGANWHDRYPAYPDYLALMDSFARIYPGLCRVVDIGKSVQGRKLLVMKITRNPEIREMEPVVLLASTIHGDEVLGFSLMLRLIEELLDQYEVDGSVRRLVDSVEIWINPLANPDGTYFRSDNSVIGATRFNARQTDLNRDFPDLQDAEWQSRPREPETTAMMSFMEGLHLVLAANIHGGSEVVNYPWDTWSRLHADDDWYHNISRTFADTVHSNSPLGYMTYLDNGITNGYAWYPVYGGRQDYTNYYLHAREVTLELSWDKMPPEASLDDYWNYNKKSLLQYIAQVFTGLTGLVTDSLSGLPIEAMISISDHDKDNSHVYTDAGTGSYFRLTGTGTIKVEISASGYHTRQATATVIKGRLTRVDAALMPLANFSLFPNPFTNLLFANIHEPGGQLMLEFFDLSGRKIQQIIYPVGYAGIQEINTGGLSPGVYLVKLTYRDQMSQQIVIRVPE